MNLAVLGLGFMGSTHLKAWRGIHGVQIAALMSSDPRKLAGDLTAVQGNLGGLGERFDFSGVRKYGSVEKAVSDPGIDAVDICLPTCQHGDAALQALACGKHVLLEKPMALDFRFAERVRRAAEESGRILMVGHVIRFVPAYRSAATWVRDSGPIHSAVFRRRCAAPSWSRWLSDKTSSGGGVFDLLIHDADFCVSLWGMPEAVRATGYEDLQAGVDVMHAELKYADKGPVIVTGGWHHPASYPFSMDFTIVAEAGTLEWSSARSDGVRSYSKSGESTGLAVEEIDPFAAELSYFADCVRHNREPVLCPPQQSAEAVALMQFMLESRERNGETVRTF